MPNPVYALNLFNVTDRQEYLAYSRRSAKEVQAHGGRVVALGSFRTAVAGDMQPRRVMILVEWSSKEAFDRYCNDPQLADTPSPPRQRHGRLHLASLRQARRPARHPEAPVSAALEEHRAAGPEHAPAALSPAAARLRRALPCFRAGVEISLCARRALLAAGCSIRSLALFFTIVGNRKSGHKSTRAATAPTCGSPSTPLRARRAATAARRSSMRATATRSRAHGRKRHPRRALRFVRHLGGRPDMAFFDRTVARLQEMGVAPASSTSMPATSSNSAGSSRRSGCRW